MSMCTHSLTTEYDPAPSVLPTLYLQGCTVPCVAGCVAMVAVLWDGMGRRKAKAPLESRALGDQGDGRWKKRSSKPAWKARGIQKPVAAEQGTEAAGAGDNDSGRGSCRLIERCAETEREFAGR